MYTSVYLNQQIKGFFLILIVQNIQRFVSKIFFLLSFMTAVRCKIKSWVLQKWPFGR